MNSKKHLYRALTWALTLAVLLTGALPVAADDDDDDIEFILRVQPGTLQAVLVKFPLEVEESITGQDVYLVEYDDDDDDDSNDSNDSNDDDDDEDDDEDDADDDDDDDNDDGASGSSSDDGSSGNSSDDDFGGLTLQQFLAAVRADPNVITFDINEDIELPEDDDTRVPPEVNTAPFASLAQDRTLFNFFGDTAWTGYVQQPANALLGLTHTHNTTATGAGIVAVIDTGVDPDHPALRHALVDGFDFITGLPGSATEMNDVSPAVSSLLQQPSVASLDGLPVTLDKRFTIVVRQSTVAFLDASQLPSSFGHGTMVAGVIRLAAPDARIMPLRAFRSNGQSDVFHILQAIYYATNNGAKVINMSFSLPEESLELTRAVNFATSRNVVCVASVGNQGVQTQVFPALLPNVIGVASVGENLQRSAFSNFGAPAVSLAAPGEGIITPFPGGSYAAVWGTSFSAPFVAATVALLSQDNPGITQADAENAVRQATPLTPDLGAGLLNVAKATGAPDVSAPNPETGPSGTAAVNRAAMRSRSAPRMRR